MVHTISGVPTPQGVVYSPETNYLCRRPFRMVRALCGGSMLAYGSRRRSQMCLTELTMGGPSPVEGVHYLRIARHTGAIPVWVTRVIRRFFSTVASNLRLPLQ